MAKTRMRQRAPRYDPTALGRTFKRRLKKDGILLGGTAAEYLRSECATVGQQADNAWAGTPIRAHICNDVRTVEHSARQWETGSLPCGTGAGSCAQVARDLAHRQGAHRAA